jgi:hypothetical protein
MPDNEQNSPAKPIKISWWKVAVGSVLILLEIKNWLTPDRNIPLALRASNETQQGAIFFTSCLICLVGTGFLVAGLRGLWLNRP